MPHVSPGHDSPGHDSPGQEPQHHDSPGHRPPRHEPARRLLLLRHGETVYNADKRMQGQIDTDLSEAGYAQAKAVAAHLGERERDIRRIVSSDLKRAHLTAIAAGEVA